MKALVTGGTGFVGPRLLRLLNQPTVLSRNPARAAESIGHLAGNILPWQPLEGPEGEQPLAGQTWVLTGTLETLPGVVAAAEPRAPTLIIVGDVVRLHGDLAWFGGE